MHRRLLTNFSLGRFDLVLGPSLHCLPPQKPHFLDHPLFDRVGLLEISLRVRYGKGYRYESLAKTRVRLKNCQKRPVAQFRRRHLPSPHRFSNRQLTPHHFESHPPGDPRLDNLPPARRFSDYRVEIARDGLPEGVEIIQPV
jgi:hypothetical protein